MTSKLEHCDDVVCFTFWFGLRGRFCKDAVYIAGKLNESLLIQIHVEYITCIKDHVYIDAYTQYICYTCKLYYTIT